MRQPVTGRELFQALFEPRAIALVGASGDASKNTSRPQRYLRKHGYGGRIVPFVPFTKLEGEQIVGTHNN